MGKGNQYKTFSGISWLVVDSLAALSAVQYSEVN